VPSKIVHVSQQEHSTLAVWQASGPLYASFNVSLPGKLISLDLFTLKYLLNYLAVWIDIKTLNSHVPLSDSIASVLLQSWWATPPSGHLASSLAIMYLPTKLRVSQGQGCGSQLFPHPSVSSAWKVLSVCGQNQEALRVLLISQSPSV
jgi:hypothetical protein